MFTNVGAFEEDGGRLEEEVSGGKTVSAAGGNGNDEVMDESRDGEGEEKGDARPGTTDERFEEKLMRELAEGGVPSETPEFADGGGAEGLVHDRRSIETGGLPGPGEKLEEAKVEKQDQADHPDPALD